jgi:hypothetical protein
MAGRASCTKQSSRDLSSRVDFDAARSALQLSHATPVVDQPKEMTMRFMVMHYQTQAMEDGVPPTPEMQAKIGEYMQEASMAGVLLGGEGVHGSSKGARVEVLDGTVRVIDGPFAEAKELIAGFALLDVRSKEEAIEHARKWAQVIGAERVDVRQVVEYTDFE